jgi:hypothetical protein
LLININEPRKVYIKFSYKDNNPLVALKTSRESYEIALLFYESFIKDRRRIYFCPNCDTLLFTGLKAVFLMLLFTGERPGSITQLLINTFDYKAS